MKDYCLLLRDESRETRSDELKSGHRGDYHEEVSGSDSGASSMNSQRVPNQPKRGFRSQGKWQTERSQEREREAHENSGSHDFPVLRLKYSRIFGQFNEYSCPKIGFLCYGHIICFLTQSILSLKQTNNSV